MAGCGIYPKAVTYNTLINAAARARDGALAEKWMQEMRANGIPAGLVSFASVIDAFAKVGNLDKAEMWFHELVESGLVADIVVYNSLINACAQAGRRDRAKDWFDEVLMAGLKPDEKTYNSIINACARVGDVANAEAWMEEMVRQGGQVSTVTFGSVLNACAKAKNVDRAEYWMQVMMQHGLVPNVVCFNSVLQACAHKADCARALKWFRMMHSAGVHPSRISYNRIVDVYVRAQDLTSAEMWLHRMINAGFQVDRSCYTSLVRAISLVSGEESESSSLSAHMMIIKAYAQAGKLGEIEMYVAEMSNVLALQKLGDHLRHDLMQICLANGGDGFALAVFQLLGLSSSLSYGNSRSHVGTPVRPPGVFTSASTAKPFEVKRTLSRPPGVFVNVQEKQPLTSPADEVCESTRCVGDTGVAIEDMSAGSRASSTGASPNKGRSNMGSTTASSSGPWMAQARVHTHGSNTITSGSLSTPPSEPGVEKADMECTAANPVDDVFEEYFFFSDEDFYASKACLSL